MPDQSRIEWLPPTPSVLCFTILSLRLAWAPPWHKKAFQSGHQQPQTSLEGLAQTGPTPQNPTDPGEPQGPRHAAWVGRSKARKMWSKGSGLYLHLHLYACVYKYISIDVYIHMYMYVQSCMFTTPAIMYIYLQTCLCMRPYTDECMCESYSHACVL